MAGTLVPVAFSVIFFWALVAITQKVSDNRLRRQVLEANPSPELVTAMMLTPRQDPGLTGALKWGIVITGIAVGIMIAGYFRLEETPLGFGMVLLGAGLGLLIYYAIAKRQYDRAVAHDGERTHPLSQQQRVVQ